MQSTSRNVLPLYNDPLGCELERIHNNVGFYSTHCFDKAYLNFVLHSFNYNCYIILFLWANIKLLVLESGDINIHSIG